MMLLMQRTGTKLNINNISEEIGSTIFLSVSEEITYYARVITEPNTEFPSSMQEIIFQQKVIHPYTTLIIFHPSFFKQLAFSPNLMLPIVKEAIRSINTCKNKNVELLKNKI